MAATTTRYLSQADIATLTGRPVAYIRQMKLRGKLPTPDVEVGIAPTTTVYPGWTHATVDLLIRGNLDLLTDTASWTGGWFRRQLREGA